MSHPGTTAGTGAPEHARAVALACRHFDAGSCRSCSWLPRPYEAQLAVKTGEVQAVLEAVAGHGAWKAPYRSATASFRNKAKMVVTGTSEQPCLGILDGTGPGGIDLQDCPVHEEPIRDALPTLAAFVDRARLEPYDVEARRGELKHLLVTTTPDGELMVRFVSRSQEPVARIRKHLPWLTDQLPELRVVGVNLQPRPAAILEGEQEIVLTPTSELVMPVNGLPLRLRPQSFFQTNTGVAAALYREAVAWAETERPHRIVDLYCGVGGFALHLARAGAAQVRGVEVSAEAVAGARATAAQVGVDAEFLVGDATSPGLVALEATDLVVVNPPRRGIGPELALALEASGVPRVLYSSCSPATLARDLAAMPSYGVTRARLFDMFPHTAHAEVLVLLERR